jgi:hypothetical protein
MDSAETQTANLIKLQAWLLVNWKRLALWAGAAVVAVLLVISIITYQSQREVRASGALSEVRVPANMGMTPPPGAAEAYLKVAREHSGTKAAARAVLLAGSALFAEGNYAEAQKQFEAFQREYPDSPWSAQAAMGVATSLDAAGKSTEAVAKYEEIRRRFGSEPVADEAKLALGRLYEGQGKNEDAFKLYDELLKGGGMGMGSQSGLGMQTQMRMQALVKKHPDLIKPKQPIVTPSMTPTGALGSNLQILRLTNQATTPKTNISITPRPVTNAPSLLATNRAPAKAPVMLTPPATTNR